MADHDEHNVTELSNRIERIEQTLGTFIQWIGQSATSLSLDEASVLLRMMETAPCKRVRQNE